MIAMDSFFTGHDVTHGMMAKHGHYHVGMVGLRDRKDETHADIDETNFPFRQVPNAVSGALPRGFRAAASAQVALPNGAEYTKRATIIMDTKLVGISHNVFEGISEATTMKRKVGGVEQDVDSCEALIWYLWMYGAVDSFDQSIGAYPVDFRANGAWVRRLFYWLIDATVHNGYIILQFHTGVYDEDSLGSPLDRVEGAGICYCQGSGLKGRKRKGGKHRCYFDRDGLSARLKYMKDLSRALIERADRELKGSMRPLKRGRK